MSLKDDMMKHRVFAQRLQNAQFDVIKTHLDILQKAAKSEALSGTADANLGDVLRGIMASLKDISIASLTDIAEYEAAFASRVYGKYLKEAFEVPTRDNLQKALLNDNMPLNTVKKVGGKYITDMGAQKKSLGAAYSQYGRYKADELAQVIKDARTNQLGATEMVAKIDERVLGLQTAQAEILAATSIAYTTNIAKSQVMANSVIQYVHWDADTELNHCDYCEEMDGQVWPIDDAPDTQVHWGCGCELIPADNPDE